MYTYLKALVQWRKFIVTSGIVAVVISVIVSLLLPKWYTATTSVFPPETKSSISPYAQILQSLQAPILGPTAVGARPGTIYIDIMKSRRVGTQIIGEFDYQRIYKAVLMEDALKILHTHLFFSLLENGLLKISFEDRDPDRAAAVTNRLVELLDKFNQEINVSKASKTREFIEDQLVIHERELKEAEEELRKFQEENEAVELDEQTRAAIEIVADLTGMAITLEVDLEILRHYTSTESEEYKRKKQNYDQILEQLRKFKVDTTRTDGDVVRSFFPTLDKVPEVALNFTRLLRDVSVGEKVYELLVKEREQARIEEARNTPTVQILDAASPPEIRSRPNRKQVVIIGGLLGVAWAGLIAIFSTVWMGQASQKRAVADLLVPIIDDFRKLFLRRRT